MRPLPKLEGMTEQVLWGLYENMLRLRRIEERLMVEYRVANEMKCPVHFIIGQEAVSSALKMLLRPQDHMFAHHRSHGYYFAKGAPLKELVAELFGKSTGANGGLAGSQEISHPPSRFHSGAILTGASSIAAGVATAIQMSGTSDIAVAGFGEAATEEGAFWEAVTYAAAKKLPLVYVCENNLYSMYSLQLERQARDNIAERVSTFGMHSEAHFGNDVTLAYQTLQRAFERARVGGGPVFLEFYTYRWTAHVGPESDDFVDYRMKGAADFWKSHCPVHLMETAMEKSGCLKPGKKKVFLDEVDREIDEALAYAKSSPFPAPDSYLAKNMSAEPPLAADLLPEGSLESFDGYQPDAILAPY